jgi:catechol-2,3-dioxygenase
MTLNHVRLRVLDVSVTRRFFQQHFDFRRIRDDSDDVFFATKKLSYEARSNADRR